MRLARDNRVSASFYQRALKIGYARGACLHDQLIAAGVITPEHVDKLARHGFVAEPAPLPKHHKPEHEFTDLLAVLKKAPQDFGDLCDQLDLSPARTKSLIEDATQAGHVIGKFASGQVYYAPQRQEVRQERLPIKPIKDHFVFAISADWHIGSKACMEEELLDWIEQVYKRGVREILVAGDISDGIDVYKGQTFEQDHYGVKAQRSHITELLPKKRGLVYLAIGGNHDESFLKKADADILQDVAERREDFHMLGHYQGWHALHGIPVQMHHGSGGGRVYALSYPLQQFIREIPGGNKPKILIQGHYHRAFECFHRNIFAYQPGAFQGPTRLTNRMGVHPAPGSYIIEVWTDEDAGIRKVRSEFLPYYFGTRTVVTV